MPRHPDRVQTQPHTSGATQAVIYVRVSSDEQGDGFSLPAQMTTAREYARTRGLTIVKEFEARESAKKAGRKVFNAMCDYVRQSNTPIALIVEKPDRLSRNYHDLVEIDGLMHSHGLEVHYVKLHKVLSKDSNSTEQFMHEIEIVLAKKFIANLSEEARKGMGQKARQGIFPGKAPLGYLNNPKTREIDVDTVRGPVVRRMFEMYAEGTYSEEDLCVYAREQGLADREAGRGSVSRSTIGRVLNNPFYVGTFVWKGVTYQGNHVPLVTADLFERVQQTLAARNKGEVQERAFMFSGLMTCGYCGCAVTAEIKKEKYVYYHCTGRRGTQCPNKRKYQSEAKIAADLDGAMAALRFDERTFVAYREAIRNGLRDLEQNREGEVTRLTEEATKVRARLTRLVEMRMDGDIDQAAFRDLKATCEADRDRIERELAAVESADRRTLDFGVALFELAQSAHQQYLRRSPEERLRLLKFMCSNFVLTVEGVVPTYRQPFALIASEVAAVQKNEAPDLIDPELRPVEYPQRGSNPCYHLERVVS